MMVVVILVDILPLFFSNIALDQVEPDQDNTGTILENRNKECNVIEATIKELQLEYSCTYSTL